NGVPSEPSLPHRRTGKAAGEAKSAAGDGSSGSPVFARRGRGWGKGSGGGSPARTAFRSAPAGASAGGGQASSVALSEAALRDWEAGPQLTSTCRRIQSSGRPSP